MSTLLTIIQDAQDLIAGMARASTVVGNIDPTVRQLLGLANESSRTLVMAHPWTVLITERTRTTVAAEVQTSFLADDFDRFVDGTMWNVTRRQRVYGPITASEYQREKTMGTNPVYQWFRKRGTSILLYPAPPAGETIRYEFVSKQFCTVEGGASFRSYWGADTDTSVLPDRLVTLGIVWMWLSRQGLNFASELAQYQTALKAEVAADGGRRILDMASDWPRIPPPGTQYVPYTI